MLNLETMIQNATLNQLTNFTLTKQTPKSVFFHIFLSVIINEYFDSGRQ